MRVRKYIFTLTADRNLNIVINALISTHQKAGILMLAGYGVKRWVFTKVLVKVKLECKAQRYVCNRIGGEKANGE